MNNTGGPAFPHEYKYGDGTAQRFYGMSLRDFFAAKAMQGICAHSGGASPVQRIWKSMVTGLSLKTVKGQP
jgi:hypothetical protein